ncbi:hypothetical protein AAVH_22377 [Aphelenchoides avenae]|nr:hypothetical protein AAVH_22377 [Aphelenchus avenae]
MLRVQANHPPLPIIDGFMCKHITVFIKRSDEPFQDAQCTAAKNQPNDQFLFVGGINEVGIT